MRLGEITGTSESAGPPATVGLTDDGEWFLLDGVPAADLLIAGLLATGHIAWDSTETAGIAMRKLNEERPEG